MQELLDKMDSEMDRNKLQRLSFLFEKMVDTRATLAESEELSDLYLEYINDGRERSNRFNPATEHQSIAS